MRQIYLQIWCFGILPTVFFMDNGTCEFFPYSTSFEQPIFEVGDLGEDGPEGWNVFIGTAIIQSETPEGIRSGNQAVMIYPLSRLDKSISGLTETHICIEGYYRGPLVEDLPDPQLLSPSSSLVVFHSTQGIMALDGDGNGGGNWLSTGVPVTTTSLQLITINQDYVTKTWRLHINGTPQLDNRELGFKDNSINQFSTVSIETSANGRGYLDDFTVKRGIATPFPSVYEHWNLYW